MEKRLYDAAVKNDMITLSQLLQEDRALFYKINLNCEDRNPLHAAAMLGNLEFVEAILRDQSASYYMCLARDRNGRNPLHLAAMYGKLDVLGELVEAVSHAALEKVDRGGTILHLCVKYNQLDALKWLIYRFEDVDPLLCAQNDDGMTILHLAIYNKQCPIIEYLLDAKNVPVNHKTANGKTAFDLYWAQKVRDPNILSKLESAGAYKGDHDLPTEEWVEKGRVTLMVVATLIATMAFQAGVSPPGGVWQDNLLDDPNPHRAGEAVLAQTHPKYYGHFIRANTVAFVSSLSTILLLLHGPGGMLRAVYVTLLVVVVWIAITTISIAYSISIGTVAPESVGLMNPKGLIIVILAGVWFGRLVLVGGYEMCIHWSKFLRDHRSGVDMRLFSCMASPGTYIPGR